MIELASCIAVWSGVAFAVSVSLFASVLLISSAAIIAKLSWEIMRGK